jgi:hypothetical protein
VRGGEQEKRKEGEEAEGRFHRLVEDELAGSLQEMDLVKNQADSDTDADATGNHVVRITGHVGAGEAPGGEEERNAHRGEDDDLMEELERHISGRGDPS